jgi:hypothetical protein
VLTKSTYADVCHIFPYCIGKSTNQKSVELWSVLEIFWCKENTAACHEIIFGSPDASCDNRTFINNLRNLIELANQAHAYWNDGVFTLKHIQGGSYAGTTEMVLEFEWLAKHPELDTDLVRADKPVEQLPLQRAEGTEGLMDWDTRQELRSGNQIILTTTDAENLPLPDERLIKLQWYLTRVLRMSGAGEDREVEYDDDSFIASPVASLVSSHNEYPAESPVGTPAVSPLNSPPKPQKQLRHGIAFKFPKPKWLWKRSTSGNSL